ncbi:MAG: hypothetical protein ACRC80_13750 [Waterburya sp.]
MTEKAIVCWIEYAGLEFEGLMLPCGKYAMALSQVARLFQFDQNQATRTVKRLLGRGFQFDRASSELNPKAVNILELHQVSIVAALLMAKGNSLATQFILASVTEKLERVFDNSFGVVIEERDREARFAARLNTKATFRPLTDVLKESGFSEPWQYGKFVKQFQTHLGFESGERDRLDLSTLIWLGNCQSELKCLIKAGYEPWTALELWKEQNDN